MAAAIAAGDAGLAELPAVCAPAGAPRQRQSERKARGRQNSCKALHSNSPQIAASWPFNNANSLGARQHRHAGETDEQPVLDDARYGGQQARQARRIGYSSEMGIDDPVAAIGDKNVAVPAFSDHHLPGNAGFAQMPWPWRAASPRGRTGSTSIGSGKRPSTSTHLDVVGDHDHAIGRRGDDLFTQQCAAAALDEIERGIDLVGAIDRQIEPVDVVERGQRRCRSAPRRRGWLPMSARR